MAPLGNYSFYPLSGLSRTRNNYVLFGSLSNTTQLLPTVGGPVSPATSESVLASNVVAFDFVLQLLNLLQNVAIMVPENLVINIGNPLLCYELSDKHLGKAISGSV